MPTLFDIPLQTLGGEAATLAPYRGNVLLLVNVASKCGLTPQYTALEALYQQFKAEGLVVLGFPANDFAGQEPGSDAEIAQFCSTEYPVTFPLFSKIVVTGESKHPLYSLLTTSASQRLANDDSLYTHLAEYAAAHGFPPPNALPEVLWNFEKFLVARDGRILARFNPDVTPDDPKLLAAIEQALS